MRISRVVLASILVGGLAAPAVVAPSPAAAVVAGSKFVALTPDRILDTRPGLVPGDGIDGPIGPASSVLLTVAGRSGVPSTGVTAAVLNVAITEAIGIGFVQVAPSDAPVGNTANLNVTAAGQTIANQVGERQPLPCPSHMGAQERGQWTALGRSTPARHQAARMRGWSA